LRCDNTAIVVAANTSNDSPVNAILVARQTGKILTDNGLYVTRLDILQDAGNDGALLKSFTAFDFTAELRRITIFLC
jgi:hypothetical protein